MEDGTNLPEINEKITEEAVSPSESIEEVDAPFEEPEGPVTGTVISANNAELEAEGEYDPSLTLELGDRVIIDSTLHGRIVGRIYYRSGELIRILPDGVSNILVDFPRVYTDEEDRFEDDLGVEASYILEKRKYESFIEQQDIQVNQKMETIQKDGTFGTSYTITDIRPAKDEIEIKDDTGATKTLTFDFTGIPLEESFIVLRVSMPKMESDAVQQASSEEVKPFEDEDEVLEVPKIKVKFAGYVEVAKVQVYREASTASKVYSDTIQKADALNDFIAMLDPVAQKNKYALRDVRIMIESLFNMKQALIQYNYDGSVKGINDISVSSIAQLLQKADVPLGRAVLDISKRIYMSPTDDNLDVAVPSEHSDGYFFKSFKQDMDGMIANTTQAVSGQLTKQGQTQTTTQHWLNEQSFMKDYAHPWKPNSNMPPLYSSKADSDVFRLNIPTVKEAGEEGDVPGGVLPTYTKDVNKNYPPVNNISSSVQRTLTTTYRKGADRLKQAHISAEESPMTEYLLFPLETASTMGTIRSGSIAIDSARSHQPLRTVIDIIADLDGVQDVPTSKSIIALGVEGNTLGNIPLIDYLKGLTIQGLGMGDANQTFVELGLHKMEMNPEIIQTLITKFEVYQRQLISSIAALRKVVNELPETTLETPVLLEKPDILETLVQTEPILVDDLQAFEKQNISLTESDIAKMAYMLKKHADYFQVAAGQQPVYTARERLRATRDILLESLNVSRLLQTKLAERGEPPVVNRCPHVAQLRTVRKIHDDGDRYQALTKLFAKYQGKREENWIKCNTCTKELLCIHERIQIQAYLSPREKDQLQKEIILHFSDGVFHGNYICRNCGQPIQELGFDTHLEYDDAGKPMMGRAVLVDKDALRQEEIDAALGDPIGTISSIEFEDSMDNKYYAIVKVLAEDTIGINMEKEGYKRIIDNVSTFINTLPNRKTYIQIQKDKSKVDYETAIARYTVCGVGLFTLIEIQTRIPDYIVRFALQGCVASFSGFPLSNKIEDKRGFQYIACAIASIMRNNAPWNLTGFQNERRDDKKRDYILKEMEKIYQTVMVNDVTITQAINDKRKYMTETLGAEATEGKPTSIIPHAFLPEQTIIPPGEAIIPEVAAMLEEKGEVSLAKAWILQGHALAKKTTSTIKGSPFIETTCCLSNISEPGGYFANVSDMPVLKPRGLQPGLTNYSSLKIHFEPRKKDDALVETPEDLMYRIFLKVCFEGPRKGLPHEPGLTNKCGWCGFQFPCHPKVMDTDPTLEGNEGRAAIIAQNVKTTKDVFEPLLDEVHRANAVESFKIPKLTSMDNALGELANADPEPFEDWRTVIETTITAFKGLPANANAGDMTIALGPLSDRIAEAEAIVKSKLAKGIHISLEKLENMSWSNFFQTIKTYFITPLHRLISNFNLKSVIIPSELDLSNEHMADIQKILDNDSQVVKKYVDDINKPANNFGRSKIEHFLKQLAEITRFENRIRPTLLPGRTTTLMYIQRAFLYGPLSQLLNTHASTPAFEDDGILIPSIIIVTLSKIMKERLVYSDTELKERIAARNEKEKANIIKTLDVMTDDEKAVEMTQKHLGMGRWAVGGTSRIYKYNAEQYGIEKGERREAGIDDGLEGVEIDMELPVVHEKYDRSGFREGYDEDGYDIEQTGEDDF